MSEVVPTICRLCIAHCGVLAEVEDDNGRRKVTRVTGDPDNPMFKGYTCHLNERELGFRYLYYNGQWPLTRTVAEPWKRRHLN